jgi:PAS domain S-box-containing protein
MKKNSGKSTSFKKLRRQAEERLRDKAADVSGKYLDDVQKLIHELEVQQIELEVQYEELRSTQINLVESRDNYQMLYDFAPVGYFTLDEKTLMRRVNLRGADLLGLPRRKLINRKFSDFISAEFQDEFYFHCKRIFESGTQQTCELKLIKRDGTLFDARMDSIAVLDKAAATGQFRTAVVDITERVQAKEVLQESEEKYRLMFNKMVSGSALFEVILNKRGQPADYRYLEVNPAFEHNTGIKKSRVIGKTLLEVFPETERHWLQGFEKVALTGHPIEIENYHRGLDKYFHVSEFRPKEGQVAVTFIDITDQKRIAKALQKAHDELEKRVEERTAELANFNASLTREIAERRRLSYRFLNSQEDERRRIALELHDELGQDLSVLKLMLDSLKRQFSERQSALNDHIESISATLSNTIKKVRGISRELIPSVLVDLGLAPALRCLIQTLAEHSNIQISSKIILSEDLFSTEQQIAIYRIFQEIFTNIRKHSQAAHVSINIGRDDSKVFFRVEDNGIGFDMERIKSISTAERGLGLAAMEERAKMLDGDFEIFSLMGMGTRIAFEIPIAGPPRQAVLNDGDETTEPLSDYLGR